jgi:hypothetical protein
METKDVKNEEDLKTLVSEVLAQGVKNCSDKEVANLLDNGEVAGPVMALNLAVDEQSRSGDLLLDHAARLRTQFESGKQRWAEIVKEMRQIRMATTTEVAIIEKAIDSLTRKTVELQALVNTLAALSTILNRPELKGLLK